MRNAARAVWLSLLAVCGCAAPPPDAYVGGGSAEQRVAIGQSASGDACTQLGGGGRGAADIYCGQWQLPAAHVASLPASNGTPMQVAQTGAWRLGLDQRLVCAPPAPTTILGGAEAALLACTRRGGGWPQVALAASLGGRLYLADGVLPTLPVIERSIAVLSGRVAAAAAPALPASAADALLAGRLAARAFSVGDIADYDRLMAAGARANLAENFAAAEIDYRAALVLQQKAVGRNNPDQVAPLMHLALQIANQGRFGDAEALFKQCDTLAPRASDQAAQARLLHYRALAALNQNRLPDALGLLDRAQGSYAALVPPEALQAAAAPVAATNTTTADLRPGPTGASNPLVQSALLGLIEVQRYRAIVLRDLNRPADSAVAIRTAEALARGNGLVLPLVSARLYRTAATTGVDSGGLQRSATAFGQVLPQTRPVAETELLSAGQAMQRGDQGAALPLCRGAGELLRDLRVGVDAGLLDPCLLAYAAAAGNGASAAQQALLGEMFGLAELAQDSITSRQIAEAAARLSEGSRDPKVAAAIRRSQDAGQALADLYRVRDAALLRQSPEGAALDIPAAPADIDQKIAAAQTERADAESVLQTAAPNYGQLVQQTVPAAAILAALRPKEAFASITLSEHGGWVFVLRDGHITAARMTENRDRIAALVKAVRATVAPQTEALPAFDLADAGALYTATLGRVAGALQGANALVVVPTGPLLSLPFGLLPTGPADQADLAGAPWLIRRMTVSHVPAAANFVALRRAAATAHAPQPWFGFGDFKPVSLPLAQKTFPGTSCADSAKLFAGLPPLPLAQRELEAARQLLGAAPSDQLLGAAYTADAVLHAPLKPYRILHFATHALLPSELQCQSQPALVTSAPAGAADASGALLSADAIIGLDLNADTVILSACNSGGPGGDGTAGDSLSGLARAFFYAGARSLVVTHWSVNDQASAFLVVDTLRRIAAGGDGGAAGSLRAAQLGMLAASGHDLPAALAHPFYWAPFALIGDGGAAPPAPRT